MHTAGLLTIYPSMHYAGGVCLARGGLLARGGGLPCQGGWYPSMQ